MKKIVRTVWISLLSGLAFLVACTSPKGLTRAEKKQLKAERKELVVQISDQASITSDNPEIMLDVRQQEIELRERLYQIDSRLGNNEEIDQNAYRLGIIQQEIDSLRQVIKKAHEPKPCVYGPPVREKKPQ